MREMLNADRGAVRRPDPPPCLRRPAAQRVHGGCTRTWTGSRTTWSEQISSSQRILSLRTSCGARRERLGTLSRSQCNSWSRTLQPSRPRSSSTQSPPSAPDQASLDKRTLASMGARADAGVNQFPGEECLVRGAIPEKWGRTLA